MPSSLYVCLQDDDKIAAFAIDTDTGRLTRQTDLPVAGGPSVLALSPVRQVLYVGHRTRPSISSFRIDQATGGLMFQSSVSLEHAPTFLATDRTGKYLLCAYYQGGYAAVHPLGAEGGVGAPAVERQETAAGAHAIQTDPSNRFDANTGRLTPNSPFRLEPAERVGPRHYCFHPTGDRVYFSNEQGCSVTLYRLDGTAGTLSAVQTVTTLPDGYSARNTCSQIHLTPAGQFLYVGNRGHNSIAAFAVDPATGRLTAIGHVSTEAVPSAFGLDPAGHFLFAAGTASGRLASYRINEETGALTPLATYAVGQRPAAVLATRLGD